MLLFIGKMCICTVFLSSSYDNQVNARALIGQSAVGYCASKLMEKSRVFWVII